VSGTRTGGLTLGLTSAKVKRAARAKDIACIIASTVVVGGGGLCIGDGGELCIGSVQSLMMCHEWTSGEVTRPDRPRPTATPLMIHLSIAEVCMRGLCTALYSCTVLYI
jgi:hypothetical protein